MPPATTHTWHLAMDELKSSNKDSQDRAFQALSKMTDEPVDWAYEVWDQLLRLMLEGDNRQRAITSQILCNLAKSDPDGRIVRDFNSLLAVTKDERFVTARHCLLSLWKVAVVGARQRTAVVNGLSQRFQECMTEKNGTLIRYDIQCALKRIYDTDADAVLKATAEELIQMEEDPKYKKKYASVWHSRTR